MTDQRTCRCCRRPYHEYPKRIRPRDTQSGTCGACQPRDDGVDWSSISRLKYQPTRELTLETEVDE